MDEKKATSKPVLKVILIILAVIVLIIAGFFIYIKAVYANNPPTIDNIYEMSNEPPADSADRFSVTEDGKLSVKVYKSDLWWLLAKSVENIEDKVGTELGKYGISYNGMGINLSSDEGVSADVSVSYKGIDVAVNVEADVSRDGDTIKLSPGRVTAAGIEIPGDMIKKIAGIDLGEIVYSIEPDPCFVEGIDEVTASDGYVVLTGKMSDMLFVGIESLNTRFMDRSILLVEETNTVMPVLRDSKLHPEEMWDGLLSDIKEDGSVFPEYAMELLSLLKDDYRDGLDLENRNYGFISRWLPDWEKSSENGKYLADKYFSETLKCDDTIELLTKAYEKGKLVLGDSGFTLSGDPFTFAGLFGDDPDKYLGMINDENSVLVVIKKDGIKDRYVPKAKKAFAEPYIEAARLKEDDGYPIGILHYCENGRAFLLYRTTSNRMAMGEVVTVENYNVRILSDREKELLMTSSLYPAVYK